MSNEFKKCGVLTEANVSYAASSAVYAAVLGAKNVNSAMDTIDSLRQQLADVSHERDLLRAAAIETLRVARIANQGSRAYRRVFEDLEKVAGVKS
jgi:biotin-(acetyl-CoA carboxylase) ligase